MIPDNFMIDVLIMLGVLSVLTAPLRFYLLMKRRSEKRWENEK
jgi:hypothetical protein